MFFRFALRPEVAHFYFVISSAWSPFLDRGFIVDVGGPSAEGVNMCLQSGTELTTALAPERASSQFSAVALPWVTSLPSVRGAITTGRTARVLGVSLATTAMLRELL